MLNQSIIISILSAVNSVLGLGSQVLIAYLFGAGRLTDAYFIGQSLPFMVAGIVSTTLNIRAVTLLSKIQIEGERNLLFSRIFTSCLVGLVIFAVIGLVVSPCLVNLMAHKYVDETSLKLTKQVAGLMWLGGGLQIISYACASLLQVRRQFFIPAIAGIVPYSFALIMLVLISSEVGIIGAAIGLVIGFSFQAAILVFLVIKQCKNTIIISMPKLPSKSSFIISLSFLAFTSLSLSDAFWGARLQAGIVSLLTWAQRLNVSVGSVLITGIYTILLPSLSEYQGVGKYDQFRTTLSRALNGLLAVSVICSALLIGLRVPLVKVLLERGNFSSAESDSLTFIMLPFLLGLPLMCISVVLSRALFAANRIGHAAVLGTVIAFLYFASTGTFIFCGAQEFIAWAYFITWAAAVFLGIKFLGSDFRPGIPSLLWIFKIAILSLLIFIEAASVTRSSYAMFGCGLMANLLALSLGGVIAITLSFTLNSYFLKLPEIESISKVLFSYGGRLLFKQREGKL